MSRTNQKLIVLAGPTASGKTELAVELCKTFGGEVVNADSRSIYKGMLIGTGSPAEEEKQGIPHHLFNFLEPKEEFSLALYQKMVKGKLKEIWSREKIPFLVGGTGLYIDASVYNYRIPQGPPDRELRKRLEKESNEKLFRQVEKLDPETATNIDPHNKRRLIRALEVCLKTGKQFSGQQKRKKLGKNVLYLGLRLPRKKLYQKIDQRIDLMIKKGLVEEVKKLARKYSPNLPSMSGIGYREMIDFINQTKEMKNRRTKEQLLAKTIDLIKKNTRGYARRQLIWFRKNKDIKWISSQKKAEKLIKNFLEQL